MATYYWVGGNGTWNNASTTNWSNASGGASGFGPPTNADIVNFDSASGTGTCTTAATAAAATVTLNSSTLGLTLGANFTMSGTFTLTAGALSLGSNTLTCNVFSSSNSNVRSIAFGSGNITLPGNNAAILIMPALTNFSYTGTPTINCTYAGSTGTRTIQSGTSGATESNVMSFNISSGSDTVSIYTNFKSVNLSGFTGTFSQNQINIYGNLTFSAAATISAGSNANQFLATSGIQQLTTAGKTLDFPITQNNPGATLQLQDNLTMGSTRTFTLTAGDLHINNRTLSTGIFISVVGNTRTIDFKSGNITLTGNNTTVWNTSVVTGLTVAGTPNVISSYSGATGTRIFNVGIQTEANSFNYSITAGTDTVSWASSSYAVKSINYTGFSGTLTATGITFYGSLTLSSGMTMGAANANPYTFAATSGTNTITFAGKTLDQPITFNGIGGTWVCQDAITIGSTRAITFTNGTVQLKAGVTSTIGSFVTSGTNQKYLQSSTPGTQATLSQASGTVNATYLSIKDINATGGATWNALWSSNNVDEGNNSGWVFGDPPIISAVEYTYALRSFTQPRRF